MPNNPGGKQARMLHMQRRLEGLTLKAVDVLEDTMANGTTGEKLAAAKEVFDRAIGKPKAQATIEVQHNASPHLTALVNMAAMTALRVQSDTQPTMQVIENNQPLTIDAHLLEPERERERNE